MSATFARLFGADPASLPAEKVLAALPAFWTRYHEWGDAQVEVEPHAATITLAGFSGSPDMCALVAAELERVVELTGASTVKALHERCRCDGAAVCEYKLAWS
jgi:hypothetical protein